MTLSAVLITKNEEKNIGACLDTLKFCNECVVLDSGSADRTVEITKSKGAKVYERGFTNFADQKNNAISKATGEWVLLVDADERVSPELAVEIQQAITQNQTAYFLKRKNRIFGRWMNFGGNQRDRQLRLLRRKDAKFEGEVHERVCYGGPTQTLRQPLMHESTATVSNYLRKLIQYSGLEAKILLERSKKLPASKILARSIAVFCDRYFLKRGFLDGIEGWFFCVLSGYYEFTRQVRRWELENETR